MSKTKGPLPSDAVTVSARRFLSLANSSGREPGTNSLLRMRQVNRARGAAGIAYPIALAGAGPR